MPRSLRFPKTSRLTRAAEFQRVREEGVLTRGKLLSLGVLVAAAEDGTRAGFITSRRVGGAVTRNRVRRRLRDIVRRHQHHLLGGAWIVVVAHRAAAAARYHDLEHEWLRLAKRASILAP